MRRAALLAMFLALAAPAMAQDPSEDAEITVSPREGAVTPATSAAVAPPSLAAAVADEEIAVTTTYAGARILLFGVSDALIGAGPRADLVVALLGPSEAIAVRRKTRRFGLHLPADPVRFVAAPSYFAVASERPLSEIADPEILRLEALDPLGALTPDVEAFAHPDLDDRRAAVVAARRRQGLYVEHPDAIRRREGGLFIAEIDLPDRAPPGRYRAEIRLFSEGEVVSREVADFVVARAGLERAVYTLAQERRPLYALIVVLMAATIGLAGAFLLRQR